MVGAIAAMAEPPQMPVDFAIIEGVFDKEKYPHRLYKKESFLGICSRRHSFAGRTVSLEEVLQESLLVREKGSGTHMLQEQAVEEVIHWTASVGIRPSVIFLLFATWLQWII